MQQRVEQALDARLPPANLAPARLHEAMRYAALGGGKRVRPLLAYAAGELTRAPAARVERVAVAVELIHAYSLVHNDMPCMDDDVLRRGRPTCHVRFDEATAMLAGDALQSKATLVIVEDVLADDPARNAGLLRSFALACGSRGMAGGQAIDLAGVGQVLSLLAELERMHSLKTGALIRTAVLLGAGSASCWTAQRTRRWHGSPMPPGWRSRWSTTCSTSRPRRRNWARPRARMPSSTSRRMSACWASPPRKPGRRRCARKRARRWPVSATARGASPRSPISSSCAITDCPSCTNCSNPSTTPPRCARCRAHG